MDIYEKQLLIVQNYYYLIIIYEKQLLIVQNYQSAYKSPVSVQLINTDSKCQISISYWIPIYCTYDLKNR